MARLVTSGFEYNNLTAGVETDAITGATVTISSSIVRSGSYSLHTLPTAGSAATCRFHFYGSNTQGVLYIRAYVYVAAVGSAQRTLFNVVDASNNTRIAIMLETSGAITLRNTEDSANIASSSALTLGKWYRVELKIDTTTLASTLIEAKLDGATFASGTVNITTGMARVTFGSNAADATYDVYFDDVAINDATGSNQTSWPGPGKIIALRTDAAGDANTFATQTGGTAGAGNNFTRVNEVSPDDATTFNGSSTLNEEDMFNVGASGIPSDAAVNVVAVGGRFRNSTADGTAALKFQVRKAAAGTTTQSAAIVPNSTTWKTNTTASPWFPQPIVLYADPDGSPWKKGTLDTMQVGYKLTTAPSVGGRRIDVSNVWALVEYAPNTANFFSLI